MTFTLPDSRFGMSRVNYNLSVLPEAIPEQDALKAANKLNEHRYLKLTNKQRLFVDAYLQFNMDHRKAAMEVGFAEEEANSAGKRLLRRSEIQEAIQLALEYYSEATKLRFEHLVDELRIIALTNITDLIDPETVEVRSDIADDDVRWHAVKSIKRTETKYGTNIEYVMHDKNSAIEKLLRILDPASSSQKDQGAGAGSNNTTVNGNVTQVVIAPVPSGHFLPPPPSPYAAAEGGLVLEHSSAPTAHQAGGSDVPRALVPLNVG